MTSRSYALSDLGATLTPALLHGHAVTVLRFHFEGQLVEVPFHEHGTPLAIVADIGGAPLPEPVRVWGHAAGHTTVDLTLTPSIPVGPRRGYVVRGDWRLV